MDLSVAEWDLYFVAPDKDSVEQSRPNMPSCLCFCCTDQRFEMLNSVLASDHYCCLLITLENSKWTQIRMV